MTKDVEFRKNLKEMVENGASDEAILKFVLDYSRTQHFRALDRWITRNLSVGIVE